MNQPDFVDSIYIIDDWDVENGVPYINGHYVNNPYVGMPVNPETMRWALDWLNQYTQPAYEILIPVEGMDDYVVRYEYALRGNILSRQMMEIKPSGSNRRPRPSDYM